MRLSILACALTLAACGASAPVPAVDAAHELCADGVIMPSCPEHCGECDKCCGFAGGTMSADGGATWVLADSDEGRALLRSLRSDECDEYPSGDCTRAVRSEAR